MDHPELFNNKAPRKRRKDVLHEWKVVSVRECIAPEYMRRISSPLDAANYWRQHIATAPQFNPDVECLAVLLLNTKLRVKGHHIASVGILNETMASPREIFRVAVASASYAIIVMHNHPSGEPEPSGADRNFTRQLAEAGKVLRIEVNDHVIIGHNRHFSFREAGAL
jgi:DNA repair protein RadC